MKKATSPAEKLTALMAEGQLLHDDGQHQAAIDLYNQAEALGSSKRDVFYSRSLSYERMGKVVEAEKDLREILKDAPKDTDAMNALGYMLVVNTTRYSDALELIKGALEVRPNSPAVMDSMGWVLFKQGDLVGAEKWLRDDA